MPERIVPVMIPGAAGERTTFRIVCHFVAPSARLPCLNESGTLFKASSVVLIIVGRTIRPSVIIPARRHTPKSRNNTRNANPKRPKTIEGVPFRRSTPNLIIEVIQLSLVYSTRYIAAQTPIGSANSIAPPTRYSVPMIAGNIPPSLPRSFGYPVRNSQDIAGSPFDMMS